MEEQSRVSIPNDYLATICPSACWSCQFPAECTIDGSRPPWLPLHSLRSSFADNNGLVVRLRAEVGERHRKASHALRSKVGFSVWLRISVLLSDGDSSPTQTAATQKRQQRRCSLQLSQSRRPRTTVAHDTEPWLLEVLLPLSVRSVTICIDSSAVPPVTAKVMATATAT